VSVFAPEWSDDDGGYIWREDRIAEVLARDREVPLYLSATVSNTDPSQLCHHVLDRLRCVDLVSARRTEKRLDLCELAEDQVALLALLPIVVRCSALYPVKQHLAGCA